ncbi:enolase C-terminal domain-like protein [Membranihabitans marinus]|uniref:enolase C-terminal domain-like protein n=1 Tax=Membranihabitans marinus TaxID=1227546 RepID=UPI001F21697E|nr:enolase C-terminal domain-like protein [Membranihabitans marinus]
MNKTICIDSTRSNFEREKLRIPFGFKGGYLSELWQVMVRLTSKANTSTIGLGTQSVLYGDADLFGNTSEAGGNAMMYTLTERALSRLRQQCFHHPIELFERILPQVKNDALAITGKPDINENFILNALIGIDNAAWLLYARENNYLSFDEMIPMPYRSALSHHNEKIGIMFQVSYNMPVSDIVEAVNNGYFIIKIKTGQSGSQEEMLQKDMARMTEIHEALKNSHTPQTHDGKIIYTIDANGRYHKKSTLERFVHHCQDIAALDQILFIEEPLCEDNTENVADLPLPIAADDSVHTEADVIQRIELGYGVLVLKGIAKTLSLSMKMAKLAYDNGLPCVCSDLTVNPLLVDWHKNLAARLTPFPKLNMGIMETNGDMNYANWETMRSYHPGGYGPWTKANAGVFELDQSFYATGGGIFESSDYYDAKV